jgi:hypothetical protein
VSLQASKNVAYKAWCPLQSDSFHGTYPDFALSWL